MAKDTISNEEKRWEAERDFETLIAYEKLIKDEKRLEAAKKLAKEKQSELLTILGKNSKKED